MEVAFTDSTLADTLEQDGRYAEAEALRRDALKRNAAKYPDTYPDRVEAAFNLAHNLVLADRPDTRAEAGSLLDQVIASCQPGPCDQSQLAAALLDRGRLRLAVGDHAGAVSDAKVAFDLLGKLPHPDPEQLKRARGLLNLAK